MRALLGQAAAPWLQTGPGKLLLTGLVVIVVLLGMALVQAWWDGRR